MIKASCLNCIYSSMTMNDKGIYFNCEYPTHKGWTADFFQSCIRWTNNDRDDIRGKQKDEVQNDF